MVNSQRKLCVEALELRKMLSASTATPTVSLDITVSESVAVGIENAEGLRAATVELSFDQDLLEIDSSSIRAGSVWGQRGLAVARVDALEGKIHAFLFSTQELSEVSGSLIEFDFLSRVPGATHESLAEFKVKQLSLNEGNLVFHSDEAEGEAEIAKASVVIGQETGLVANPAGRESKAIQKIPAMNPPRLSMNPPKPLETPSTSENNMAPQRMPGKAPASKTIDTRPQPQQIPNFNEPLSVDTKETAVPFALPSVGPEISQANADGAIQATHLVDAVFEQISNWDAKLDQVTSVEESYESKNSCENESAIASHSDPGPNESVYEAITMGPLKALPGIPLQGSNRLWKGVPQEFHPVWQPAIRMLVASETVVQSKPRRAIVVETPRLDFRSEVATSESASLFKARDSSQDHLGTALKEILPESL